MEHYRIPCEDGDLIVLICQECGRILGIEGKCKDDLISYCPYCHHKIGEHKYTTHQ